MKLAEALLRRAECQEKLEALKQRILASLKVQENEKPFEDPYALLDQALALQERLCEWIGKINRRNAQVALPSGELLADALVRREMLLKKRNLLMDIVGNATEKNYRLTHAEVKMVLTMDIGKLNTLADDLSKQYRELDTTIQALNWTEDLE